MKGKVITKLRKKLCVLGLAAASAFIGTAAPLMVNMTTAEEAQAAVTINASRIKDYFNGQVGQRKLSGYCLKFCDDGYASMGFNNINPRNPGNRFGSPKLMMDYYTLNTSKNPPIGAYVIFYSSNVSKNGHVGIWVGDGVVATQGGIGQNLTIDKKSIDQWASGYGAYQGWVVPNGLTVNNDIHKQVDYAEAYYTIQSAVGSGTSCVEVAKNSVDNGTAIQIWQPVGTESQSFYFKKLGNGYYHLINKKSGKVIDTEADSNGEAKVHQWSESNANGSQWRFIDAGNGYCYIQNKWGNYLSVTNGSSANGTGLRTSGSIAGNAQKFRVTPNILYYSESSYIIQSATGDTGNCVEVAMNSKENGAGIQIWSPVDTESQIFYFKKKGNGYYHIVNKRSGKVVDTEADSNGEAKVHQWSESDAKGSQWRFIDAGDGYCYIQNKWGNYLSVANGYSANGTGIRTSKTITGNAEKFRVRVHSGNPKTSALVSPGKYKIFTKMGERTLNVVADGRNNGDNIQIWDGGDYPGNIFSVEYDSSKNAYYIVNNNSGKAVDSKGNNNSDSNVQQYGLNKCYGQTWYFEDAGDGYIFVRNQWGLYLEADNAVNKNGTNVSAYPFQDKDNYKWKFVRINSVSGVSLSEISSELTSGETKLLTATVSPSDANNKKVTWSSSNTSVATVDSNGKVTGKKAGTAKITVKTADGGYTASCTVTVKAPVTTGRFSDVSKNAYYYNAVEWAAAKGIATGSNGKFLPNDVCTREEAITFLWRMYGKPAPKSMNSKFSDVRNKSRYSYNAIMWGTENGIITGSNGKFAPTATCTREQIITMLWRLTGKPNPRNMTSKFSDVKNTNSYSYKAILWANQNGIATGANGKFYPATKCKRCEIVTFIYRYSN